MKSPVIIPVIMCGGSGKRLWPLSRENFPKQFLRLDFDDSLLQQTIKRFSNPEIFAKPLIITNYQYRFHCAEQLSEIGIKQADILLERHSRNTAPALAAASHFIRNKYGDNYLILAIPSDHYFQQEIEPSVSAAIKTAKKGNIVAFGIPPTHPETGYGYIQSNSANKITKFHEKPDHATAEKMFEEGNYLWNSGIFLFSPQTFLSELERYKPQISTLTKQAVEQSETDLGFICLGADSYSECEDISVDYALMENTDKAYVTKLDIEWKDIGSWQALYDLFEKDADNNVIQGKVLARNVSNSFIRSSHKLTAIIGAENLLVIDTQDALLIADRANMQGLKIIVESIKSEGYPEYNSTTLEYRPWGYYAVIQDSPHYKVKKIHVHPGKKISLQKHQFRAEHWVVLSGTAKIICDGKTSILRNGESTYIPNESLHRIENIGVEDLVFIEVQTGANLSEDDITRYDDDFGRCNEVEQEKAYA